MERVTERIELGQDAREYASVEGVGRMIITAMPDGRICESSALYITDANGVLWEWRLDLDAVLREANYTQCNLISPHLSRHTHGVTMLLYAGSLSFGPDKYEPHPLTADHIMAILFRES